MPAGRLPQVLALVVVAAMCGTVPARAERLPFTTYTTAHGLASDDVSTAVEDARGFLWIGTYRGLSRFDGRAFRNFGREHGLDKSTNVTSLAIGNDGTLWVGVWGGMYRFDWANGGSFKQIPVDGPPRPWERVTVTVDLAGRIWCAANGLYRLEKTSAGDPVLRPVSAAPNLRLVSAMVADRSGNFWVGSDNLYRHSPDGRWLQIEREDAARTDFEINSLIEDRDGRIWAATIDSVWRVDACPSAADPRFCRLERVRQLDLHQPRALIAREAGGFWAGTSKGIVEIDETYRILRTITHDHGLFARYSLPILLDRDGDLWIAGNANGIQRLSAEGFSSFGLADGLEAGAVSSIIRTRDEEMLLVGSQHVLYRHNGQRFVAIRPALPAAIRRPGWGWHQVDLQDRAGDWWIPTDDGLVRFPKVRRVDDLVRSGSSAVLIRKGCFQGHSVFRLYEDSRGDIWIGTTGSYRYTLYRWNRASDDLDCHDTTPIVGSHVAPTAFLDDGRGTLWIGFGEGQIARYREGRFECVFDCGAGSQGTVHGLFLDRRGRLWVPTQRAGLLRTDNPEAVKPVFARLTTKDGLSSNLTRAVVEDRFGRIYVGTERGVDVLDDMGRRIRHFGTEDGLPHAYIIVGSIDSAGDLWFGTVNGAVRFTPRARFRSTPAPWVSIDRLHVAGVEQPLSAAGETHAEGLELEPDQRSLQVDYVGLPRSVAGALKFQYRLSDLDPWSTPSADRSIVLAGLSTGSHRLEIRALDAAGVASPETATVSLRVLAPFYWRPWFVIIAATAVLGLVTMAYRARVGHLTALERQRTQIAMDLHDEMGSQLGSIGLLADLAADGALEEARRKHLLEQIAETAADMGSSLSDIVWSLRRGEMTIENLARHLAGHGRRLFPGREPAFDPDFPDRWPNVELSLAAGRSVLLVGVEALHNAARHSGARRVGLTLQPDERRWRLIIRDDGKGIEMREPSRQGEGFGLETMRHRAEEIGATLVVDSRPAQGTTVSLCFDPRAEDRRLRGRMNIREIWNRFQDMT